MDRSPEVVEVAAGLAGDARAVVADLAAPGWLDELAAATEACEIGLAVANAATSYVGRFLDQPAASRLATVQVNCLATTELAAWALPPMVARGRGGLVVTSSGSALAGTASVASYSASKAYVLNLAEAIGWELRGTGVDCQAVVAPAMDTPGWRSHPVAADQMLQPAVEPHARWWRRRWTGWPTGVRSSPTPASSSWPASTGPPALTCCPRHRVALPGGVRPDLSARAPPAGFRRGSRVVM